MNYVYDVLLNFNKELYDFFDWNINDHISHIRKIMIFKVDDKIMKDLKKNNIVVSNDFLIKISNRTEMFTNQNVKIINYASLFTNGLEVIAIKFDKNGNSIEKSYLLIDEETEILDSIDDIDEYNLKYDKLNENSVFSFKTRKEKEIEKFIKNNLKKIDKNDKNKLGYLYFECFNKKETNFNKMLTEINRELKNNWDVFYLKVYNFFKLTSVKSK